MSARRRLAATRATLATAPVAAAAPRAALSWDVATALEREKLMVPLETDGTKAVLKNHRKALAAARKYYQNNPVFARMANIVRDYVLGADGVELLPRGSDAERRAATAAWAEWTQRCDARGEQTLTNLEREIVTELAVAGEVLVVIEPDATLTLIDSEHIERVEVDARRRATAYVVKGYDRDGKLVTKALRPRDCVYLYHKVRTDTTRGSGLLWPSLTLMVYLDQVYKAEAKSAVEASKWLGVIKSQTATQAYVAADGTAEAPVTKMEKSEAGYMLTVAPGEDASIAANPRPSANFGQALRPFLQAVCASVGLSLDLVLGDYANMSFSAAKAMSINLRAALAGIGNNLIHQFYRKVFSRCVGDYDVDFALPQIHSIDELQEAKADAALIAAGLQTQTGVLTRRNLSLEELQQEREAELKRLWQTAQNVAAATGGAVSPAAIFATLSGVKLDNTGGQNA